LPDDDLRKAVFLDRDNTIIEDRAYSADPASIVPLAGAIEAMRRLQDAGYLLVIITNQSGVARGYFEEEALRAFNAQLIERLRGEGVTVAGLYYCPHYANGKVARYAIPCDCRKPAPGMLIQAAEEHGIALAQSWMIGDKADDVGAGKAGGCRTIRVLTGKAPAADDEEPDFTAASLADAADLVLGD